MVTANIMVFYLLFACRVYKTHNIFIYTLHCVFKVYKSITALKEKNPQLKVLLSVEWFTSSGEFAWVVSTHKNRTRYDKS